MRYHSTMLCRGDCGEYKPCEHIKDCTMCVMNYLDEDFNERYVIGLAQANMLCKREHPNFKPLTKHQFIELYKQMPEGFRTTTSIDMLIQGLQVVGLVEQ